MKKRIIAFGLILLLIVMFTGCAKSPPGIEETKPDTMYRNDNSIDMLVYDGKAFVNAADYDWVADLELSPGQQLGTIKRTDVTRNFKDFDATKIETGVIIYAAVERGDFVLADIDGSFVPYYAWVEG